MKKARTFIFLTAGCIIFAANSSCIKTRPKKGDYLGNFYGATWVSTYYNLDVPIEITKTKRDEIELKHSEYDIPSKLTIYGDSIEGFFNFSDSVYQFQPYLLGTWSKEKSMYFIEGYFVALRTDGYEIKGPFTIESLD